MSYARTPRNVISQISVYVNVQCIIIYLIFTAWTWQCCRWFIRL